MSDGNYGSTAIGVMMEENVLPGERKSEVLETLINQQAAFLNAKFEEMNKEL